MAADNNNDRELLELAAKAAGLRITKWATDNVGEYALAEELAATDVCGVPVHRSQQFNPLRFDGDALRLAVKLNIQIAPDPANRMGCAWLAHESDAEPIEETIAVELWRDSDEYAATRRAIVRAAAAIGGAA